MVSDNDSPLLKKIIGEFTQKDVSVEKLVKTLVKSFLRSRSDYGMIEEIESDINTIHVLVNRYLDYEKADAYAFHLEKRIFLSKTGKNFEDLFRVIKEKSELKFKKDMIEIWDDFNNKLLHLIIIPIRKHFPIEYSTLIQRKNLIRSISNLTFSRYMQK